MIPASTSEKRLVLLSGGLDSTTLLATLLDKLPLPEALFVDYGQPAADMELVAARAVSARYSVRLTELSMSGLEIGPSGEIPGRNALLAVVGFMYVMTGPAAVFLAIHSGTGYHDCSPAFVAGQQRIFDLYAQGRVILSAPFVNWSKSDIWAVGKKLRIPTDLTYSCERGLVQPCGGCRSCDDLKALLEAS